ncbi:hypothetical protein GCM10007159_42370 [Modicisalibacter luteus]|nr:hypothetical protein GCM10007159_42370 [Halomonas lutea]
MCKSWFQARITTIAWPSWRRVILDEVVLSELDRHFDEDRSHAIEMRAEDYRQRGLFRRAKAAVAGLFRNQT